MRSAGRPVKERKRLKRECVEERDGNKRAGARARARARERERENEERETVKERKDVKRTQQCKHQSAFDNFHASHTSVMSYRRNSIAKLIN